MKKYIIIISLCIFALASCTSSEEPIYSCDPTINTWVKSNIKHIQDMKRAEWLNLEESKKKPAYRAFTPDEKYTFWVDKLNEVLTLDWSDSEKTHIAKLNDWISKNPQIFEEINNDSDLFIEFEKFTYLWINEGKSNFGWDKQIIYSIAFTGNTLLDVKGNIQITKAKNKRFKVGVEEAVKASCDCTNSWDCLNTLTCDEKKDCKTRRACGLLSVFECDGLCSL